MEALQMAAANLSLVVSSFSPQCPNYAHTPPRVERVYHLPSQQVTYEIRTPVSSYYNASPGWTLRNRSCN
jgi:hypothetical protein